ncbi:MAG: hypothetical protein M3525_10965 [Acidobacteriota bacterium]|nr:hypothetical protein [Acidobacteriota bacterium]
MQEENKTIVTPEGYTLKFREQEMVELKLDVPKTVLNSLEKVAAKRNLPLEAVVKFYIGQGLRLDVANFFSGNVLEKTEEVLSRRLQSKEEVSEILHEIKMDLVA